MISRRIAVLGSGSWGTALASHLAHNGHLVQLWGRSAATIESISKTGVNSAYLPDIALSESLSYTHNLTEAIGNADDALIAVPSHSFASMADQIFALRGSSCGIIWACKGLQADTGKFLSEVLDEKCPGGAYAIVSGPTFAAELAAGLPTAITVAANTPDYAKTVADCLHNDRFRAYTTSDIRGVQIGGALKNIYAIAAGISDGLGFGANARVALITRGLAELSRLGASLGVSRETLMGLSGMGDLILTCTDNKSRNRQFGLAVASGMDIDEAQSHVGQSVEGVAATKVAKVLAMRHRVEMPIVDQVYEVIENGLPAAEAVDTLLRREPRTELTDYS